MGGYESLVLSSDTHAVCMLGLKSRWTQMRLMKKINSKMARLYCMSSNAGILTESWQAVMLYEPVSVITPLVEMWY